MSNQINNSDIVDDLYSEIKDHCSKIKKLISVAYAKDRDRFINNEIKTMLEHVGKDIWMYNVDFNMRYIADSKQKIDEFSSFLESFSYKFDSLIVTEVLLQVNDKFKEIFKKKGARLRMK